MRTNLPVTNVEKSLSDDSLIVTKTNLKGLITYVNRDFVEISGFSEQELLGEPHNLVRHPDMPPEAFKDLWDTLKQGRPWTGLVKNRCKNGDYYWVLANVAPIVERGQVSGYISVRRKPDASAVAQAEDIYRRFREKRQGRLRIRYGQVVKRGQLSFGNISVGAKLWGGIGVMAVVAAIAIGFSWWGMRNVQQQFDTFVGRDLVLQHDYDEMYAQGLQMGQAVRNIILDPENRKAYDNLELAKKDFQEHFEEVKTLASENAVVQQEMSKVAELRNQQTAVHAEIFAALKVNDQTTAKAILNDQDTPIWRAYKKILLDGRAALEKNSTAGREDVYRSAAQASGISLLFGVLAILFGGVMALALTRLVRRPMAEMADTFANVLQGNYNNSIDISRNDEIGKAMQGLQILQTRTGFDVAESRRNAERMARIMIALENVSSGIMIADDSRVILYANKAATKILKSAEEDIRKQLPDFSAENLVGQSIDAFHRNPSHQARLLSEFTSSYTANIEIGSRFMTVCANPVIGKNGERLGSVAEWSDRTSEVMVEREVASLVQAAANGDFSQRLELKGKEGFFLQLGEQMNLLVENSDRGLREVVQVMAALAQGDLTRRMVGEFSGTFGQLKDDVDSTINNLQEIISSIKEATDSINTAAKEIASGNTDLSSRTEEQASSLEETASSMEELSSAVKQNADNARQANEQAGNAQAIAVRGGEVVGQVVETMGAIHQSSSKIADIIGVIDGIAFQTNILALNAAVEAARAGEQGRGFAVVATEVRNLAQRSAAAAKEIKGLISDSVGKVEVGNRLAAAAGETMGEVVASIRKVTKAVTEITAASHEQSSGIEQVSKAVSQMDEVTQQNAALVEQAAAAAESLEEQADQLTRAVSAFRLTESAERGVSIPDHGRPAKLTVHHKTGRAPKPALPSSLNDEWQEF